MGGEGRTDPAPAPAAPAASGRKHPRDAPAGSDLKRVAEIVMVLSGLGEMRAGREPSAAEKALAAEAKGLLVGVCEGLNPKDLFPRDAVRGVVEELGLNRLMDPSQAGRPAKMSIADKLQLTKKRMEEKKDFAALHASQPQGSMFPGAPPRFLPSTSVAASAGEASHCRMDAQYKGPSYSTQVRAEYAPARIPPTLMQSTSAATVELGQENKLQDHTLVKSEGVHEGNAFQSSQLMRSQGTLTSVIQNTPGNLLMGSQPLQSVTYVHGNHNDIAKSVLRVLQQKAPRQPNWNLPLIDYMSKPLNCQVCKNIINDVESLMVCDFCEKGTHLKCLQSYGNKGIPKADWFCPACLLASNGKTYPPKYGRVTRSIPMAKTSSNTIGTRAFPEKRAVNSDSTLNIKFEPNGKSDLVNASNMKSSHAESVSDLKSTSAGEMRVVGLLSSVSKREDGMHTGTSTNPPQGRTLMVCSTSRSQSESSSKQAGSRGLSTSDVQRSTHELKSTIMLGQNGTSEAAHQLQAPSDPQVCNGVKVQASVEVSPNQSDGVSKTNTNKLKPSDFGGLPKIEDDNDSVSREWISSQTASDGGSYSGEAAVDCGRSLHTVDWVGDILETIEGKAYYQSCWVNGTLHKVEDHVLISSDSTDMSPSKLQSLWEDTKTGTKWASVDTYYLPDDLSDVANRPSAPDNNEVYASNKRSTIMASSIHGPCEVLPIDKFREESDKRTQIGDTNKDLHPIFMCRWLYDESKGTFQSVTKQ